jgi:hypothetical protein
MSQSTRIFTRINFLDKTYNSKSEVERDLENVRNRLEELKSHLRVLAYMTEPNKFKDPDQSTDFFVDSNVNYLYESFEELFVEEWKLSILLDRWDDCHNIDGLGIEPDDDFRNRTFIDGDFVLTNAHPTKESLLR